MDKSVDIDEITDILVSLEFCAFSLTRLHFIHFDPKLSCIGIPFMKNATKRSLDILSAIIDDGYIFTQAEEYEEEKMRMAVADIKSILETIEVI